MKGNDLKYNVYLRKLQKLTRTDLGLDVLAYKDYENNLREFANINKDLNAFALEALAVEQALEDREHTETRMVNEFAKDQSEGLERVAKHKDSKRQRRIITQGNKEAVRRKESRKNP